MTKIQFNRKKCIGCGGCAMIDSDHFEVGDDGKANLISGENVSKGGTNSEIFERKILDMEKDIVEVAIDACPAGCIKILK